VCDPHRACGSDEVAAIPPRETPRQRESYEITCTGSVNRSEARERGREREKETVGEGEGQGEEERGLAANRGQEPSARSTVDGEDDAPCKKCPLCIFSLFLVPFSLHTFLVAPPTHSPLCVRGILTTRLSAQIRLGCNSASLLHIMRPLLSLLQILRFRRRILSQSHSPFWHEKTWKTPFVCETQEAGQAHLMGEVDEREISDLIFLRIF
jgi:hypothetical protein